MSSDWFTQVDFSDSTYDEYFQRIQDPEAGHEYIQYLHDNLDPDGEIHGYAQVDLFRATMQYTEEFLIYFLSYINTEDNFVEDLIRNQVRTFAENYLNGNPDGYFEDADFDFDNRLKAVFGYAEILGADDPASRFEDELTAEQIEEYVTQSVEHIHSQLTEVCRFYIDSIDMYNSTKHGNKYQISPSPTMEIHGEITYDPEQAFASFLCKRSSDTGEGDPYIVNYPLDRLVDRSLSISDVTKSLFTYMDTVVEDELEENVTRTKRFFTKDDSTGEDETEDADDEDEDGGTIEVWNQDSKTVLPRTEELAELVVDPMTEVAVRVSINNDTIRVETMGDSQTSEEYPVIATISLSVQPGPRLITNYNTSFDFDTTLMDVKQYSDLLKYSRKGGDDELSRTVIKFEDTGVEITESIGGGEPPEVQFEEADFEMFQDLALAQTISQTYLPLPPTFLEGQTDVIVESVQGSPSQDDVIDAIEEAQEMGDAVEYTQILAESPDDDGLELLDLRQGFLELEYSTEDEDLPGTYRELCEHPEYDNYLRLDEMPGTYEQFINEVKTMGLVRMVMEGRPDNENGETTSVEVEVNYKAQTFWYDLHRVIIRRTD